MFGVCLKMKQKSSKLRKLENNRTSIMTDNLKKCMLCENNAVNKHEIFYGRNRQNSMKYGLVMPLCYRCHLSMHRSSILQEIWHVKGQIAFEEHYPELDFLEIFGRNYK